MGLLLVFGLVGLELIIQTLILGFTVGDSLLRPGALPLVIFLAFFQLPYFGNLDHPIYQAFIGGLGVNIIINYINTVLVDRWTFEAKGPTSSTGGLDPVVDGASEKTKSDSSEVNDDALKRLRFGLNVALQCRFPATKWPVKNIPPFSREDPEYVPERSKFLRQMIIKWVTCVLILDLVSLGSNNGNNALIFSSARIPLFTRLYDLSGEEVTTRITSVIAFWTIQYIVIEVMYGMFAIAAVALGITAVNVWPPVFGSLRDSYSLRQFWG